MDKQFIVTAQCLRLKLVSIILILYKAISVFWMDKSTTEPGFWCENSLLEVPCLCVTI